MACPSRPESDDEYGYDLSLEDEQLFATIVDVASASPRAAQAVATVAQHVAPNTLLSSPQAFNAFAQDTQPQPAPSVVPVNSIQYPDCKSFSHLSAPCKRDPN